MGIISTHDYILHNSNNEYEIVLKSLADEHLSYLYRWNADPEVLYWTEGEEGLSYSKELVERIYGGISKDNICFIIEVNKNIIGECWLQQLNFHQLSSKVREMYPKTADVRRIDMCIGEKQYWGKGIGTLLIEALVEFAFNNQRVDALHCICEDYNVRSARVFEKNGFQKVLTEKLSGNGLGKYRYHLGLTKGDYNKQ